MRVLYINSVCGFGSTGRIVVDLARMNDSLVCYGRKKNYAQDINAVKITSLFGNMIAVLETVFFDKTGFTNTLATRKLIREIKKFNPDIIHIHNMHGYYMNIKILFEYLSKANIPVVMTLHDCFNFTGYCPHYDYIDCHKFQAECEKCPMKYSYPFSIFKQNTTKNYYLKKECFNKFKFTIVTPSTWLANETRKSFLASQDIRVINNGINLKAFYPSKEKNKQFTITFIASIFTEKKGIKELVKLIPLLSKDIKIVVVGKSNLNFKEYPNVEYHQQTQNIDELRDIYSKSHLFINLTLEDTFPTVNIEALACGTPVITYNTGGSPEIVDDKTGIVIEKRNIKEVAKIIEREKNDYSFKKEDCIDKAKEYNLVNMCSSYQSLYKELVVQNDIIHEKRS